ncbi:hypothetical protein MKY37_19000 [Psychrobacillus sp. FSL K6-2836]|uniref:hypothetical protein n=1 Tax=Psychrobacillus sp. FSL K6-2836 TaxID=2921548 RepID=UPI0030FB4A23
MNSQFALLLEPSNKWKFYDVQDVQVPMLPQDVATLIGLPVKTGLNPNKKPLANSPEDI